MLGPRQRRTGLLGIGGRTARSARTEFSDRLGVTLDDTEVPGPAAAGSEEPVADVEVASCTYQQALL